MLSQPDIYVGYFLHQLGGGESGNVEFRCPGQSSMVIVPITYSNGNHDPIEKFKGFRVQG